MPSEKNAENRLGNECSCGQPHYCHIEIMEIVDTLRRLHPTRAEDRKAVDDVLRKYDPNFHSRRVREWQDANKARS